MCMGTRETSPEKPRGSGSGAGAGSYRGRSRWTDSLREGIGGFPAKGLALVGVLSFAAVFLADSTLFVLLASEPTAVPTVALAAAAALVPALLVSLYVWASDPGERKSVSVLAAVFFLGAVVTVFAGALNGAAVDRFEALPVYAMPLFFYLFVGPVEEGLKLIALRLYPADLKRFDRAVDYAVMGAFVGLGFAFVENAVYVAPEVVSASSATTETVVTRASVGPLHVMLTAIAGYYVGKARLGDGYGFVTAAEGLLAVALLHGTYNTMVSRISAQNSVFSEGFVGAGLLNGEAAATVFVLGFFSVVLYLLERTIRAGRNKAKA